MSPENRTPQNTKSSEHESRISLAAKRTIAGLTLSAAAFGLVGCATNSAEAGNNKPPASSSQEATPTPEATETPEAPTPEELAIEAQEKRFEELEEMSWDEFRVLDKKERLLYAGELLELTYNETAVKIGDEYLQNHNPRDVAAIDNSGETILLQYTYMLQAALAQRAGDRTSEVFDPVRGNKALTAVYYNVDIDVMVMKQYNQMKEAMATLNVPANLGNDWRYTGETDAVNYEKQNGETVTYKDVYFDEHLPDGSVSQSVARFAWVDYTDIKNEPRGVWQIVNYTDATDVESLGHRL